MQFSEKEFRETERVSKIMQHVDSIDRKYINTSINEIYKRQPFINSLILGYRMDFNENEFEEITKLLLLIWEYFNDYKKIRKNKITEEQFERLQRRNISMLKYSEGERIKENKTLVVSFDIGNLTSKALLAAIFLRFDTNQTLTKMKEELKGIVVIGLKSLIQCFEEINK